MNTNSNINLMDINGICDPKDASEVISQYPYWIQLSVPENVSIPSQKPDVEQLNSVTVSVNIINSEVIKTPVSPTDAAGNFIPNIEGKISTGRKIVIEGELCQEVSYTAAAENQPVHSAHFYVPFSGYIIVPQKITFIKDGVNTVVDSMDVNFQIGSCVEDLRISLIDSRTINKQVTLLLYAVPSQS